MRGMNGYCNFGEGDNPKNDLILLGVLILKQYKLRILM